MMMTRAIILCGSRDTPQYIMTASIQVFFCYTYSSHICAACVPSAAFVCVRAVDFCGISLGSYWDSCNRHKVIINNNNRRLVTLAEHTSDHGRHKVAGSNATNNNQRPLTPNYYYLSIIIIYYSLRRACLRPATNTQDSKPRPPTTNARRNWKIISKI